MKRCGLTMVDYRRRAATMMHADTVMIGWEGRSPFPSPHTTVRTGPYTAVQESRDRTGI